MWDLFRLIVGLIFDLFRSRAALEAEVFVLKQQIIVLRRHKLKSDAIFGCRQVYPGLGLPPVSEGPRGARHRSTGYRGSLASCRFPIVLAPEVQASSRPSSGAT
jgi:hypothetical protein